MSDTKIIFLDIDGVLNSELFALGSIRDAKKLGRKKAKAGEQDWRQYHLNQIDPTAVSFLNSIIEQTGAKVVLSSTWRLAHSKEYMQSLLAERGFTGELIDRTPSSRPGTRGLEIEQWLAANPVEKYVILDDDSDMTEQQLRHHFVHCDRYCGLSPTVAYKASRILNGISQGQFRGEY